MPGKKQTQNPQDDSWLGYTFSNPGLLAQALTHGSAQGANRTKFTYERLEFLGDRVLSLVIADALFQQHDKEAEGKLSARLSALVRADACADVAEALGVADHLHVGAVERKSGVQKVRSVLSDVMEAIIGAIYLDGGYDAARRFTLDKWQDLLSNPATAQKDAKTFVQEWALARGRALPTYEVVKRSGPEHRPVFSVKLSVARHGEAEGQGPSRQLAEMDAAAAFIAARGLR